MGDPELHGEDDVERAFGTLSGAVLRHVWSSGELSVAEVTEMLQDSRERPPAYTTVLTVMARLAEKGLLERRKSGRQYRYRAAMTRDEAMESTAGRAVDQLVARYGASALREFAVRLDSLDPDLRRDLAELAARHEASDRA